MLIVVDVTQSAAKLTETLKAQVGRFFDDINRQNQIADESKLVMHELVSYVCFVTASSLHTVPSIWRAVQLLVSA